MARARIYKVAIMGGYRGRGGFVLMSRISQDPFEHRIVVVVVAVVVAVVGY